jgi:pyridoxine 5'-phosphate synthase PdxJ
MQLEFTLQRATGQSRSAGLNSNLNRAVMTGLETAVKDMLRLMGNYRG